MKPVAIISSGFLRNYRFFLKSNLYKRLLDEFDSHVYISTWNEDGYGANWTPEYSKDIIPENQIREDFGDRLRFLHRESFEDARPSFRYDPVMPLLAHEPIVLEKYRAKFRMVSKLDVPEGYSSYFHLRFDMHPYPEISDGIIECLHDFTGEYIYTAADIFWRPGCFGDVFQIFDRKSFLFFQDFEKRLYSPEYLSLDIPTIPERILHHYFSTEMPSLHVRQLPFEIRLNRDGYSH